MAGSATGEHGWCNGSGVFYGSGGVVVGTVDRVGKVVEGLWGLTVTVRIPGSEAGALLAI